MGAVPRVFLPGRLPLPLPPGAPPPAPVLDMMDSKLEGLESKQIAWRVHGNCSTRKVSQDHSKQSHLIEKCEEIAGIACAVVTC